MDDATLLSRVKLWAEPLRLKWRPPRRERCAIITGTVMARGREGVNARRGVLLQVQIGRRLCARVLGFGESVRATLDDASLDFPAELTALPQGDANAGMMELQQQVEMLLTLLERFGPRLRLLPAALAHRDRLSGRSAEAGAVATGSASGGAPNASSAAVSAAPATASAATPASAPVDAAAAPLLHQPQLLPSLLLLPPPLLHLPPLLLRLQLQLPPALMSPMLQHAT